MASEDNKNASKPVNKLTPGRNLLWESSRMMLPEHKEAYIAQQKSIKQKKRPTLDEQRLQELSLVIAEAISTQCRVAIQLYDPYDDIVIQGRIERIQPLYRKLKLIEEEEASWIALEDIIDVFIL